MQRTVRGYEAAGVAAIQIEDQEKPKKCGHTPGRRVVPAEEMVMKIRVAAEARRHAETMIVARTDARTALGLDEALRRARLYEEAGADVIFVELPESEVELERIGRGSEQAAARQHGRVRQDAAGRDGPSQEMGLRHRDLPQAWVSAWPLKPCAKGWQHLKEKGTSNGMNAPQFSGMHELMGFPEVWEFEKKWAQ